MKKLYNKIFPNSPSALISSGWKSKSSAVNTVIEQMQDEDNIRPSMNRLSVKGGNRNFSWEYTDIAMPEYRLFVYVNGAAVYMEPKERKLIHYLSKKARTVAAAKFIQNAQANR